MIEGVDYAWSRPDPTRLAAAGKVFACRYLSFTESKNLTSAEQRRLAAAGVAVVCNWEAAAAGWRDGHTAGLTHAREALRLATELGCPPDRPIYFSIDSDVAPSEMGGALTDYLTAVASVIGERRVGVYGGYWTVKYALDHGLAAWAWQTYAWSDGMWEARAHIQQYRNGVTLAGGNVDLNRATVPDYGQWGVEDVSLADMLPEDAIPNPAVRTDSPRHNPPGKNEKIRLDTYLDETYTMVYNAAKGVAELVKRPPVAPVAIDAEQLRAALLDPVVLEAIGKAVAGQISALDFEVVAGK